MNIIVGQTRLWILLVLTVLTLAGTKLRPSGEYKVYLPLLAKPVPLEPSLEAILQITPAGGLYASTFEPGSFVLSNPAGNNQAITLLTIDLRTAVFPDMVFDPHGTAGDVVAKNLEIDANGDLVGFSGHALTAPHDDGFDVLLVSFAHFEPGEFFAFSIDVDPTSIRGSAAPGPNQSGSVSGLELTGVTVTVEFADGTTITGQTYRVPGSMGASEALIRSGLPAAPTVQVEGISGSTAVVTEPQQTLLISAAPWTSLRVLVIEGGLFTDGVPGGGYDLEPFEANSALSVQEYQAQTGHSGQASLPILLSRSQADGGLNHIVVLQENAYNLKGALSTPIILQLQD